MCVLLLLFGYIMWTNSSFDTNPSIINDDFSISFKPNEFMPELNIGFLHISEQSDEFFTTYIYRCTLSQADRVLQSFEMELTEVLDSSFVNFVDVNFDGFLDVEIISVSGSSNWPFVYYRYDADNKAFDENLFFSALCRGVNVFPDTKQIIVTSRGGAYYYEREMYQYADGEYTNMRREYLERIDLDLMMYDLRIMQYDEDSPIEIYSATLTAEEYYGDTTIRDNYLRFGKRDNS